MKKIFEGKKGSVLAFTLIVMFVFLVIAIGIATVSVKDIKMSSDTGKSTVAFQAADSGMEKTLQAKKDNLPVASLADIADSMKDTCAGGEISGTAALGNYTILFYDVSGQVNDCAITIDTIIKIKSSGSYSGTNRAVEVDLL